MRSATYAQDPTIRSVRLVETLFRQEDAERFIEEVRGDDPELAGYLRIEERELVMGGRN